MMKRYIALFLALSMLCVLIAGCGGDEKPAGSGDPGSTGEPKIKETMVLATTMEPPTLDPRASNTPPISFICRQIFDTLFIEEDDGTYTPALATSWEWVDDLTLRVKLRDDVVFHNGEKMTAEDVRFSLARTQEDSISASTFNFIDYEKMAVVDDTTLDIALVRPYAPIFNILSGRGAGRAFIVSKKAVEEMGPEAFARNPVGSGPFKFVSWDTGVEIKLERFDEYWDSPAKTKNLDLKIITEPASRVIELETGAIDFAYYIDSGDIDRVNDIDGYHAEVVAAPRYTYLAFSMQDDLLANKDVRYALSYAIDKQAMVDAVYHGTGTVANGMFNNTCFSWKENPIPYDLEKAKELMKQAGYEDGFEITLLCEPKEELPRFAQMIQEMWAKLNVKANIMEMSSATFMGQGNHFMASISDANANEPGNIFIIYTKAFGSRLQPNDQTLEDMIVKSEGIYDVAERTKACQEIQDYLHEIRFSVPLSYTSTIYGMRDTVKGFNKAATPLSLYLKDMYVEE